MTQRGSQPFEANGDRGFAKEVGSEGKGFIARGMLIRIGRAAKIDKMVTGGVKEKTGIFACTAVKEERNSTQEEAKQANCTEKVLMGRKKK